VRVLQRGLVRAGDRPGPVDGRYGPLTERAVGRFQAAHGLAVDGIAGPHTTAALSRPTRMLFPTAGYGSPGGSAPVRVLQRGLVRAGDRPGPIDGRYGPLTEQAVRRFQAAHHLPVNGIAGPETFTHLNPRTIAHRTPASPRRSRPLAGRPKAPSVPPVSAPAPISVAPTVAPTHSSRWPAIVLALVVVVLLGLSLRAVSYRRERRANQRSIEILSLPTLPAAGRQPPLNSGPPTHPEDGWTPAGTAAPGADRPDHTKEDAFDPRATEVAFPAPADGEAALRRGDQLGDARAALNLGLLLESRYDLAGAEAAYRRADQRGEPLAALRLRLLVGPPPADPRDGEAPRRAGHRRGTLPNWPHTHSGGQKR
jgi:peptidoglycan hydrolase-like protein with peptidoglycan-binding domain